MNTLVLPLVIPTFFHLYNSSLCPVFAILDRMKSFDSCLELFVLLTVIWRCLSSTSHPLRWLFAVVATFQHCLCAKRRALLYLLYICVDHGVRVEPSPSQESEPPISHLVVSVVYDWFRFESFLAPRHWVPLKSLLSLHLSLPLIREKPSFAASWGLISTRPAPLREHVHFLCMYHAASDRKPCQE